MLSADNEYVAKLLINNGIDMDTPNYKGWTALHEAIGKGNISEITQTSVLHIELNPHSI